MPESLARELILTTILAILVGVLYRCWLIYPILQLLTIGQWRLVALLVAVALGMLSALLRIRTYVWTVAVLVALLFGGALTALFLPIHDVRTTFSEQFVSHFNSFWRELAVLTAAATASNLGSTHVLRRRRRNV